MPGPDDELEAWATRLPFPIAASLWSFTREEDERARLEAALYVFDATARYLGVLLLSGLRADRAAYLATRPTWQGSGAPPSVVMRRTTLGSWVTFDAALAKAVRQRLHVDAAGIARAFGLADHGRLASVAGRDVGGVLSQAVQRRNEWHGHTAGVTDAERRRRIEALDALIHGLRVALAGSLDFWSLVAPKSTRIEGDRTMADAFILVGPNPRVRSRSIPLATAVRTDAMYAVGDGSEVALELVPLIRTERPEGVAESAVYFFDRLDGSDVRWLSYDSEARPELREPAAAGLLDLLTDLDDPAGPSSETPEPPEEEIEAPKPPEAPRAPEPPKRPTAPGPTSARTGDPLTAALLESIRGLDPPIDVRPTDRGFDLYLERRIGSIETWGRTRRVSVDVPIERAPQLAGIVVTEIPVSANDRPGIRFAIEDVASVGLAAIAIGTAVAVEQRLDLESIEVRARIATLAGLPDATPVQLGDGLWPPVVGRVGLGDAWAALEEALVAAGITRPISRTPTQLRVAWAPRVVASIRVSSETTSIGIEFEDADDSARVEAIASKLRSIERAAGAPLAAQRQLGSLLLLHDLREAPNRLADPSVATRVAGTLVGVASAVRD